MNGTFVERERLGSIAAVEAMLATAVAAYRAACKHDGIVPVEGVRFAVFSPDNPYVPFVDKAFRQYQEMAANVAAHGYEGLRVGCRDLFKPGRKASSSRRKVES